MNETMSETKSQAVAEYAVRAREPLPPDESAPVPFRVSRAGRIVDVVDLPPNVAVVRARLGRAQYSREEMKTTFAEFLALEPQEVKAGTYCVFTVMNVGAKPANVTGKVIVEGEHGEVVEGLPLREATADDMPAPMSTQSARDASAGGRDARDARNVRNAANDAMVDAIIDNATMADGTKAKPLKSKSSKSGTGTGRRPSPTPMTAPMPRAGALKPQKVMTKQARRRRYEAEAEAEAAARLTPRSSPVHGSLVVLLHVGSAAMLDMTLSARIPLGEDVRSEIGAALREAREDATADGVGVVAIPFAIVDCERLLEAIDVRAEFTLESTEAMCAAIQQALDGSTSAEREERAVSLDSESESKTAPLSTPPAAPSTLTAAAETEALSVPASVESADVGNVTPIHGKVQDDGRPQSRPNTLAKSVVNDNERAL